MLHLIPTLFSRTNKNRRWQNNWMDKYEFYFECDSITVSNVKELIMDIINDILETDMYSESCYRFISDDKGFYIILKFLLKSDQPKKYMSTNVFL
ncbi:hypothetical protein QTN25_005948 [Entamoeba marina]